MHLKEEDLKVAAETNKQYELNPKVSDKGSLVKGETVILF